MASGAEADDPLREARAYNNSIYLMVSMPYLLLGVGGLLIYRAYRVAHKKAELERQLEANPHATM